MEPLLVGTGESFFELSGGFDFVSFYADGEGSLDCINGKNE
jgi:hypothetical protein